MLFTSSEILLFVPAALIMVLTPSPNMVYCFSRTMTQGRRAGFLSLGGVMLGSVVHLLAASFGLMALLLAVPLAFELIKWLGAAGISRFLTQSPRWIATQRWIMGAVLGGLAVRLAFEGRKRC